ncbi:MAG TPA: hypothetical protein VK106_00725, partial [Balneolaceae bacterium]|nr:hypothetical protein [Balneolaceae bacterium]
MIEPIDDQENSFYMYPSAYPMNSGVVSDLEWSVEPEVKKMLWGDIYLYVAGSTFIERKKEQS